MRSLDSKVSREEIGEGLRRLGVREGMGLAVHSSLSSFGYVEGGAETVIEGLIDVLGANGSIVMPSFRMSKRLPLSSRDREIGLSLKIRITDPDSKEPTGMGVISDTFRSRSDVLTSSSKIIRVSAWGVDKEKNSRGFSNLIEQDQWALLLGVDIYSFSAMHYVEEKLPEKIRSIFKASDEVVKIYPADQWWVETGSPPVKAWYKIQDQAYARGRIKDTYIGKSKCMFFKIRDVIGLYEEALERDPYGLYEVPETS